MSTGRNDPCPCGSGRRYKQCCGRLGAQSGVSNEAGNMAPALAQVARGDALARDGRLHEAIACYQQALAIRSDVAEAHFNMGNALQDLGRSAEAVACYGRVLTIAPESAEAHHNLGNAWRSQEQLERAIDCYRRALQLKPGFAVAHWSLGTALRLAARGPEAEASLLRALELAPDAAGVHAELAELRADQGQRAAAEELYRRAIALDPHCAEAWLGLSRLPNTSAEAPAWLGEAERIADSNLPPRKELLMRYALGKALDDCGQFDRAFANYRRANELSKSQRVRHDRERLSQLVDRIVERQSAGSLQRAAAHGVRSARPVFIVGMLRAGTTLAEQILASHPAVFGAGELPYWNAAAIGLGWEAMGQGPAGPKLAELARQYLRSLPGAASEALRIIDKTPGNFLHLGLIQAALPEARIIHMRRDPLDTCLSIYFQHLEGFHSYATDLEDLAHYYTQYRRLMRHWRAVLPATQMLEVPYEGLVAEPELWSCRMVEYIGLPWDRRCLDFHRTERTVLTASKWQVRQAMNASSIGRAHAYRQHLGPLLALTEPR